MTLKQAVQKVRDAVDGAETCVVFDCVVDIDDLVLASGDVKITHRVTVTLNTSEEETWE